MIENQIVDQTLAGVVGALERRVEELENDLVSVHYTVDREHEMIEKLIIVVAVIALAALVVATFVWIHML